MGFFYSVGLYVCAKNIFSIGIFRGLCVIFILCLYISVIYLTFKIILYVYADITERTCVDRIHTF